MDVSEHSKSMLLIKADSLFVESIYTRPTELMAENFLDKEFSSAKKYLEVQFFLHFSDLFSQTVLFLLSLPENLLHIGQFLTLLVKLIT